MVGNDRGASGDVCPSRIGLCEPSRLLLHGEVVWKKQFACCRSGLDGFSQAYLGLVLHNNVVRSLARGLIMSDELEGRTNYGKATNKAAVPCPCSQPRKTTVM